MTANKGLTKKIESYLYLTKITATMLINGNSVSLWCWYIGLKYLQINCPPINYIWFVKNMPKPAGNFMD